MKWLLGISILLWLSESKADSLVMFTEHFPPYSFEQNQQITGLNTELVRRSCQLAALECEFRIMPWLRAYDAALQTPLAGLYSTSRNPLRESSFQWVGPLAHANAKMFWLNSRSDAPPKSLAEAKNYIIAVARGDIYELYLQSQGFEVDVNLLRFNTKSDAVLPFLHGKVDLLIASELILPVWLGQYQHSLADVTAVLDISGVGSNYLALNNAVSRDIVERLQQAIDQLKANGEFDALSSQFLQVF